mmetsp:Transcript_3783/g.8082  ORF Transcript_3783/g.8082 Transcript_3783/m.8082 type:complete len:205 (+) Transcript_3783:215-829(+)
MVSFFSLWDSIDPSLFSRDHLYFLQNSSNLLMDQGARQHKREDCKSLAALHESMPFHPTCRTHGADTPFLLVYAEAKHNSTMDCIHIPRLLLLKSHPTLRVIIPIDHPDRCKNPQPLVRRYINESLPTQADLPDPATPAKIGFESRGRRTHDRQSVSHQWLESRQPCSHLPVAEAQVPKQIVESPPSAGPTESLPQVEPFSLSP